jgi:hypothetical protein
MENSTLIEARFATLRNSKEEAGVRVGLQGLLNDQNEDAKLLVSQMSLLKISQTKDYLT